MNLRLLQDAVSAIKVVYESVIDTAVYNGKAYPNGLEAKKALITSQSLIQRLHEVAKVSLRDELISANRAHDIYPPVGQSSPELSVSGYFKTKKQDVVVLFDGDTPAPETIDEGLLAGDADSVGKAVSERSVVVGVRSQLSSVAKNYDTLMERTFAETLNMRMRLPKLVMGEVYLLPVFEYDSEAMKRNQVGWLKNPIKIDKFIRIFLGFSGRAPGDHDKDHYKYERSALVLVDFKRTPPKIYLTLNELKRDGHLPAAYQANFHLLSPDGFAADLVKAHRLRHP